MSYFTKHTTITASTIYPTMLMVVTVSTAPLPSEVSVVVVVSDDDSVASVVPAVVVSIECSLEYGRAWV